MSHVPRYLFGRSGIAALQALLGGGGGGGGPSLPGSGDLVRATLAAETLINVAGVSTPITPAITVTAEYDHQPFEVYAHAELGDGGSITNAPFALVVDGVRMAEGNQNNDLDWQGCPLSNWQVVATAKRSGNDANGAAGTFDQDFESLRTYNRAGASLAGVGFAGGYSSPPGPITVFLNEGEHTIALAVGGSGSGYVDGTLPVRNAVISARPLA